MAFDFVVTVNSVIDRLPNDLSQITATTEPVSSVSIETWVDEASSEISALFRSRGFTSANIPDDVVGMAKRAIRAYAASESLKAFGLVGNQYSTMLQEYEAIYTKYEGSNDRLGDQVKAGSKGLTRKSNSSPYLDRDMKL